MNKRKLLSNKEYIYKNLKAFTENQKTRIPFITTKIQYYTGGSYQCNNTALRYKVYKDWK